MQQQRRSRHLRFLIKTSGSPHFLARLLKAVDSDENLELARDFVDHEHWYVRNQAVAALGRLGSRADLPLLVARLGDEQWWVRYRAAKGLAHILQGQDQDLVSIRDEHDDRYARQMIDQILAEGRFVTHEFA
jgi:HEAT repeat protein